MGTQNSPLYRENFVWGHKIPPIGIFLCADIKFPLYRENFVWGHKISPIGKFLCGDIKFPL